MRDPVVSSIAIVAALVLDRHGRVLLVRKRGTESFMQPGGKRDPGEADSACLDRELREELGVAARPGAILLGRFTAAAANEPGMTVDATVYRVEITGVPTPAAEIDAVAWVGPDDLDPPRLAPLTRDVVLPLAATLR